MGIAGRDLVGRWIDQSGAVHQGQDGRLQGKRAAQSGVGLLPGEDAGCEMPCRSGFHRPQADQERPGTGTELIVSSIDGTLFVVSMAYCGWVDAFTDITTR